MQLSTLRSQCCRRTGRLITFTALVYFLTRFSTSPSLLAFYSVAGLSEPEAIADKAHADALSEWSAHVPQELHRTAELLSRVALTSLIGADRPAGRPSAAFCGRNGRQAPKPPAAFVGPQLVRCLELSAYDEACWSAKQARRGQRAHVKLSDHSVIPSPLPPPSRENRRCSKHLSRSACAQLPPRYSQPTGRAVLVLT